MSLDLSVSFDDVLIRPTYSEIKSRNDVDTSVIVGGIKIGVPLISSPMDTVTEVDMAATLSGLGGLGILHRFASDQERLEMIECLTWRKTDSSLKIVPSFGVTEHEKDFAKQVIEGWPDDIDMVCVDVANGFCKQMEEMVLHIRSINPSIPIIAGNIADGEGYRFMSELGVDAVRVGIGGGCFTESTKVLMSDGTYKNINKIIPGEYVINRDGKSVKVNAVINNGFKKVLKVRTSNWAEPFYVTPNHQYWVSDLNGNINWVPISEIDKNNAFLLSPKGPMYIYNPNPISDTFEYDLSKTKASISNNIREKYFTSELYSIKLQDLQQETWDIEVDCPTHSFIANNSIVHNSICKTRIQTGIGIPTLQSVLLCHNERKNAEHFGWSAPSIIADGGIKYPADLCKAMIAGADAVICGGIFAGTKEAPGDIIYDSNNKAWKKYRGMASESVQAEKRGGLKPGTVAEGVSTLIEYKGSLQRVVEEFHGGLKSSMTYVNARNTSEYIGRSELLLRITENGLNESHAYGTRVR